MKKAQNIEKIYAGINYIRKDGTSKASEFVKRFVEQHPECVQYYGDLRFEKIHFKKVYRFYTYNYNGGRVAQWKSVYQTWVEV